MDSTTDILHCKFATIFRYDENCRTRSTSLAVTALNWTPLQMFLEKSSKIYTLTVFKTAMNNSCDYVRTSLTDLKIKQ